MKRLFLGVVIGLGLAGGAWWYASDGGDQNAIDGIREKLRREAGEVEDSVQRKIQESVDQVKEKIDETGESIGSGLKDAQILAAVKTRLFGEKSLNGLKINVDVKDGVVTLRGEISSEEERATVIRIARDTEGVEKIRSQLELVRE